MMHSIAQAIDVTKRFGSTTALDAVSIAIAPGETHALVGRNGAGKSTLVSLLTGLQQPDDGSILFDGAPAPALADRAAWRSKVACVYQHSMIVPHFTVAENIFLNRYPQQRGTIAWRRLRARARELMDEWQIPLDVDAQASALSVEERQLIEIVRALSFGARFIILDEPTAHLEAAAITRLFAHLRSLKAAGVTMLFISHHLQEVYEVCDTVTVLRDGKWICTNPVSTLEKDALIEAMTGEAADLSPRVATVRRENGSPIVLETRNLRGRSVHGVSLLVRAGELVGLAGIGGSGTVDIARAIAGLGPDVQGEIVVNGRLIDSGDVRQALEAGVGFVPRDRLEEGLVLGLSVAENSTMTIDDRLGRFGFIQPRKRDSAAQDLMTRLGIVASDTDQPVDELSGGNQQKTVFARALARKPKLLVLVHPTAGVDVRSKETLLQDVQRAREAGTAVLIVSDEMEDLRPCDRVYVIRGGQVAAEMPAGWHENELIAQMEGVSV
jgi:simple sugar transport system ATP-binding protein